MFGWPKSQAPAFEAVQGDIFKIKWQDADMIFINSTCFNQEMMEQIYQQSLSCKRGTWVVTNTMPLPHAEKVPEGGDPPEHLHWQKIYKTSQLQMSWGKATLNLFYKITEPVSV